MTMRRIALFRLVSGTEHIATELAEMHSKDIVRTSEYVEVDFPPVDAAVVASALESQRQASIAWHRSELAKLQGGAFKFADHIPEVASLAKRQAE